MATQRTQLCRYMLMADSLPLFCFHEATAFCGLCGKPVCAGCVKFCCGERRATEN